MICGACAAAAIVQVTAARAGSEANPARNKLAQPGDLLVEFDNGQSGAIINPADVKPDTAPLLAWPFDPAAKLVRNGSRLNLVLVMRFDPATLSVTERPRAANGIVAYTAVCAHQACWVTDWLTSKQVLQCPCHQSEYDPRRAGKVVGGPAPRALPGLPLRIVQGRLEVAAPFTDRVGGEKATG